MSQMLNSMHFFSYTFVLHVFIYPETLFFEVLKAIKAKCSLSYSIHICCRCSLVSNKNFSLSVERRYEREGTL